MSEIANFLAAMHKDGYQSSSLNSFRSAISSVHDKVDGVDIVKHPLVARLLKGAFVMLLSLTRPSCSADLASLCLDRRQYKSEGVVLFPTALSKQSRQSKQLVEFFFLLFLTTVSCAQLKYFSVMNSGQRSLDPGNQALISFFWQ